MGSAPAIVAYSHEHVRTASMPYEKSRFDLHVFHIRSIEHGGESDNAIVNESDVCRSALSIMLKRYHVPTFVGTDPSEPEGSNEHYNVISCRAAYILQQRNIAEIFLHESEEGPRLGIRLTERLTGSKYTDIWPRP